MYHEHSISETKKAIKYSILGTASFLGGLELLSFSFGELYKSNEQNSEEFIQQQMEMINTYINYTELGVATLGVSLVGKLTYDLIQYYKERSKSS